MLKHGGKRKFAGRKRKHSRGVAHRTRERITPRTPLHINFKYKMSIRNKDVLRILKRAIVNAGRFGMRVTHYSLQSNHIHLIVEADNNEILTTGMRSITCTITKSINKGKIQLQRFHLHVLRGLRETKNAIRYVLFNEQKHGGKVISDYSSLLNLKEALVLIRNYVQDKKISVKVEKARLSFIYKSRTWLGNKALAHLAKPYS